MPGHVVVNEAHLRALLGESVAYCNSERPPRGLHLEPPPGRSAGTPAGVAGAGPIRARPVLGGLHHVYRRAA